MKFEIKIKTFNTDAISLASLQLSVSLKWKYIPATCDILGKSFWKLIRASCGYRYEV